MGAPMPELWFYQRLVVRQLALELRGVSGGGGFAEQG